jgi:cell shape-determining protein MreC
MNGLRFNHVFGLLLLLCAIIAFVPQRFIEPARAQVQNIYAPVSRPAGAVAGWIRSRFDHQRVPDPASPDVPRSDDDIRQENLELRELVLRLTTQLQKVEQDKAEYEKLGSLVKLCTRYPVSAGDSGTSESLLISGGNFSGLKAKMPAVYPGGIAGFLQTPGLTGTRIRLITDREFKSLTGVFVRFIKMTDGSTHSVAISTVPRLVCGEGKMDLLVDSVPLEDAKEIQVNDWFVVDDSDPSLWAMQGQLVGQVREAPVVSRRSPGFAEIHLKTESDLMELREVMIVDKGK